MEAIHSLKGIVFILTGELAVIHCFVILSGLFSKKVGSSCAVFERYYNYFYRIFAAVHSFNGTVYFSEVKICSHPILLTHFLSAYSRTPATLKQTSSQSSYIFRRASIILKREQPIEGATFLQKDSFSEYLVIWSSYFFLITASWYQILFLISYFLKIITFQHSYCFGGAFSPE